LPILVEPMVHGAPFDLPDPPPPVPSTPPFLNLPLPLAFCLFYLTERPRHVAVRAAPRFFPLLPSLHVAFRVSLPVAKHIESTFLLLRMFPRSVHLSFDHTWSYPFFLLPLLFFLPPVAVKSPLEPAFRSRHRPNRPLHFICGLDLGSMPAFKLTSLSPPFFPCVWALPES